MRNLLVIYHHRWMNRPFTSMERDSTVPCSPYVPAGRTRDDVRSERDTSCTRLTVERHPLRYDRTRGRPRTEAHEHPLRLVHSRYLYPRGGGKYVCDAGQHRPDVSNYVFNCSICEFDICLECMALSCYNCPPGECTHAQITVKLL